MSESKAQFFRKLKEELENRQSADKFWTLLYRSLEDQHYMDINYVSRCEGKNIDTVMDSIGEMTFQECCTWLTWMLRGERFCDGLFESCIDDGSLSALLERACELSDMESE